MTRKNKAVIRKKPTANAKYQKCTYCGCERHRHTKSAGCLGQPGLGGCACDNFIGE